MAKKFGAGVVTGVLATVGALAAGLATYKKKVVEPEQKEADRIEQNRIKANRKSLNWTNFVMNMRIPRKNLKKVFYFF